MFNVIVKNATATEAVTLKLRSYKAVQAVMHNSVNFCVTRPSWMGWSIKGGCNRSRELAHAGYVGMIRVPPKEVLEAATQW
jgi:hypothetical protein